MAEQLNFFNTEPDTPQQIVAAADSGQTELPRAGAYGIEFTKTPYDPNERYQSEATLDQGWGRRVEGVLSNNLIDSAKTSNGPRDYSGWQPPNDEQRKLAKKFIKEAHEILRNAEGRVSSR